MKKLFFIFCLLSISCSLWANPWPKIYDCTSHKWTDLDTVKQAMAESKMVFVGEKHDHKWGHKVEFMLLESFWQTHGKIAMAMEMFERDVQSLMDGYIKGEVKEKFFLQNSRPWKNYQTDYRPLVEFNKRLQLPVLAMNVPRRYASFTAKGKEQALFTMPDLEKSFMAEEILALEGKYKDKFTKTMKGHVPPEAIERYYRSQCLKDDTMAKSILEFFAKNPDSFVISYVGAFHSDEKLGVVEKVAKKRPELSSLVITIVPVKSEKIENPKEYSHLADFVFFAPANKKQ